MRPAFLLVAASTLIASALPALAADQDADLAARVAAVEPDVVRWRRDIHQHPELGNRETRTSALVAAHLKRLKLDEVRTGIAHTGVIGVLKGKLPGPVIALRADMDALPVTERTGLPFASTVKAKRGDETVGVMHACGHDAHTAMMMGVAEVLSGMRDRIAGTVVFVFQPAEEGAPQGEEGGAALILKEGALSGAYAPEAIFGLHVWPGEAGTISYRARGSMASADRLVIKVTGKQTHGAQPWHGIDPITTAAQIVTGLQMIPARQVNITTAPAVVTIGRIQGGTASNIVPETVDMEGTIRTFDPEMREDIIARVKRTATDIAAAAGARADVEIQPYAPPVYNDVALVERMEPTLRRAAGDKLRSMGLVMGSEDFAHYQTKIPGLFFFLGVNAPGVSLGATADLHSPEFMLNEDAMKSGVQTMSMLALDYLKPSGS